MFTDRYRPPAWHYAQASQLLAEAAHEFSSEIQSLKFTRAHIHALLAQCDPDVVGPLDDLDLVERVERP